MKSLLKGIASPPQPFHRGCSLDRKRFAAIGGAKHRSNTTFNTGFFAGDSAMHSLCTCIALHLHIGFEMYIEYTGVFWFAMHCLSLAGKDAR